MNVETSSKQSSNSEGQIKSDEQFNNQITKPENINHTDKYTQPEQIQQPKQEQQPPQQPKQTAHSSSTMPIKIAAVIIILAIIAYAVYYFFNSISAPSSPVIEMLSMHKPINFANLTNTMFTYANSMNKLNVSYNSSFTIVSSSAFLGNETMTIPMNIKYKKYYNTSRIEIYLKSIPMMGDVSIVEITNKSLHYSCLNNSLSIFSGYTGFVCQNSSTLNKISPSLMPVINENLMKTNFNIIVEGTNVTSYKGQSCYLMKGNGVIKIPANFTFNNTSLSSSSYTNLLYNISSCISSQYGLPLNLTMTIMNTNKTYNTLNKILLKFEEINLNTNTNSNITILPGPIQNTTLNTSNIITILPGPIQSSNTTAVMPNTTNTIISTTPPSNKFYVIYNGNTYSKMGINVNWALFNGGGGSCTYSGSSVSPSSILIHYPGFVNGGKAPEADITPAYASYSRNGTMIGGQAIDDASDYNYIFCYWFKVTDPDNNYT